LAVLMALYMSARVGMGNPLVVYQILLAFCCCIKFTKVGQQVNVFI